MANIIKRAVFDLIEKTMTTGQVLSINNWGDGNLYAIELHLPTVDFSKWNTIKRLKCKVADFEYRDYTPTLWNAAQKTCTLLVEAGHNGAGSRWAKKLDIGDSVMFAAAHAAPLPATLGNILCLGDASALGHLLSLKQLTSNNKSPLEACIFLHENIEIPLAWSNENPEFDFIADPNSAALDLLNQWSQSKNLERYSSIYLAGNIAMVTGLRKTLKAVPNLHAKVYAHGFWS